MTNNKQIGIGAFLSLIVLVVTFIPFLIVEVFVFGNTAESVEVATFVSVISSSGYFIIKSICLMIIPAAIFSLGIARKVDSDTRGPVMGVLAMMATLVSIFFIIGTTLPINFSEYLNYAPDVILNTIYPLLLATDIISSILLLVMAIILLI